MVLFLFSLIKRYTCGFASVSNLSDEIPWGIWKGLNVFGGVALASGGYVITSIAYIFNVKEFKIILKPLILISFLGYLTVILALLIDDGRPWNIIMPLIFWNTNSVMWEVSWCVATYTIVLFLEFCPLFCQKFGFDKSLKFLKWLTPSLVFLGVILSTLHQSSLGTLLVLAPSKIHPFWYSKILPLLFFLSSFVLGISTINLTISFYKKHFSIENIEKLLVITKRLLILSLSLYLITRSFDLFLRNPIKKLFTFDKASILLLTELFVFGFIPLILLSTKRNNHSKIFIFSNLFIIFGVVLNRINVSVVAFQISSGAKYFPTFFEIVISISLFSIAIFVFNTIKNHFPFFPKSKTL